jgi:hypothetical protein
LEPDGRRRSYLANSARESGFVRPTLEVILTESPAHLRKAKDPESGLALIRPGRVTATLTCGRDYLPPRFARRTR